MPGTDDPYAILGLAPDAEAPAIERAYRTLIKQYHPDRPDGDAVKAAAINRAYRQLRDTVGRGEVSIREPIVPPRPPRRALWIGALLTVGLLAAAALIAFDPTSLAKSGYAKGPVAKVLNDEPMEGPLDEVAIVDSARQAFQIATVSDEMALTDWSRTCHSDFQQGPTLRQLDRCVAFDDAAIRLLDRDPMRDRGPFSQLAVTGRSWGAADALSDNDFAIDARLKAIQSRVRAILAIQQPD